MKAFASTSETMEELIAQNERLQGERSGFENTIAELREEVDRVSKIGSNYIDAKVVNQRQIDSFMEALVEYIKGDDIDKEVAADLAACFNRELTRKVYGRIYIEGDVELAIPLDLDLDNIAQELDIHIGEAYTSDVKVEYSDVSEVEVKEN